MYKTTIFILSCALVLIASPAQSVDRQEEKKIAYGVLLDNTASLKKRLAAVKLMGHALAKRLHQRGPIVLMNFQLGVGRSGECKGKRGRVRE